jgi:hypothetical protein
MENFRVPGLTVEGFSTKISAGTTAQRPNNPAEGQMFGNISTGLLDFFIKGGWLSFGASGLKLMPIVTADSGLAVGNLYPTNTNAAAVRLSLPNTAGNGDEIMFFDLAGTWDKNPVTVTSSQNINNKSGDQRYGMRGGAIKFTFYSGTGWVETHRTSRADMRVTRWEHLTTVGPHNLEPDVGYTVSTVGLPSPMTVRLPNTNMYDGATIMLVDIGNNLKNSPILISRNNGTINGDAEDYRVYNDGATVELRGFTKDSPINPRWFTTVDNGSGGMGKWLPNNITGTGSTLSAGEAYFIDTATAVVDARLPASPRKGDSVWIVDFSNSFDERPFTLKRATSGEYIDHKNADFVFNKKGAAAMLTYSGTNTKGWLFSSTNRLFKNASVSKPAAASTMSIDVRDDVKTIEIVVDRNITITGLNSWKNEAVSFFIVLKMDGTGGYTVNLPSVASGWIPAVGSQPVLTDANTVTIIQGIAYDNKCYYSVTGFQSA